MKPITTSLHERFYRLWEHSVDARHTFFFFLPVLTASLNLVLTIKKKTIVDLLTKMYICIHLEHIIHAE